MMINIILARDCLESRDSCPDP